MNQMTHTSAQQSSIGAELLFALIALLPFFACTTPPGTGDAGDAGDGGDAGGAGKVVKSFTWTELSPVPVGSGGLEIASSADGGNLAIAVYRGHIHVSSNAGLSWIDRSPVTGAASGNLSWNAIVSSADGSKLAALVTPGFVYTSQDFGLTWAERKPTSTRENWSSISMSAEGSKLAAVSRGGQPYTSVNFGSTWEPRTPPDAGTVPMWTSIAASADGTKLVAVVEYGSVFISDDSGATWEVRDPPADPARPSRQWRFAASSANGQFLVVAGYQLDLYTSTDRGLTWKDRSSGPTTSNPYWKVLAVSSDGSRIAVVTTDSIHVSTDFGDNWKVATPATGAASGDKGWTSLASNLTGTKFYAVTLSGQVFSVELVF